MNRHSLTKIAAPATAAILLVSTLTFGIAANAQTTPIVTPPVTQSVTQAATQSTTPSLNPANPRGFGFRLGLNIGQAVLQAVETATGLTQQQIVQAYGQGQNLTQILTAHNGDPAAIKTSVLATLSATIAQDVKDGKLTQTQADQLNARLGTAIDQVLTRIPPTRGSVGQNLVQITGMRDLIAETAKATGLTTRTIIADLRGGQTLAQIAIANKGDTAAIVAAAVTDVTTHIQQQVTSGRITQAQADQLLANLSANLTTAMNAQNPLPFGARGGSGNGRPAPTVTPNAPSA